MGRTGARDGEVDPAFADIQAAGIVGSRRGG